MMKEMEGLIYEERLKKPSTRSGDPEVTLGNWITDNRYLEGVNHLREGVLSPFPKTSATNGRVNEREEDSLIYSGLSPGKG